MDKMVLQIIPDRFAKVAKDEAINTWWESTNGIRHVRRPTRGIAIKDETFATLRCVAGNGRTIHLIDAGSRTTQNQQPLEINGRRATDVYSNFLLQQVSEDRMEKQQILETFGEPYIFLFGQRARVVSFQGVLLNTFDFNWEAEWWYNYDTYLRGTKCVENDARIFLSFDETVVGGYIIGTAATKSTENRNFVNFQFQMFVTSYHNFSDLGDPSAIRGKRDYSLSAEEADAFRPDRQIPIEEAIRNYKPGEEKPAGGLFDSISKAVSTVKKAWTGVQNTTNFALKQASNLLSGEVVRVPVGFAGSMVYDEKDDVVTKIYTHGKVTYTTFDKNDDEYVGGGTHYGSAWRLRNDLGYDFESELQSGEKLAKLATKQWEAAGLKVGGGSLGPVESALLGAGVGLISSSALVRAQNSSKTLTGKEAGLKLPENATYDSSGGWLAAAGAVRKIF